VASERTTAADRFALRAQFPCAGADLDRARGCEQAVFGRRFGNTPEQLRDEYGSYEATSVFGAVFAADGTAIGAVRLIGPGPARVKTLRDASQPPWSVPEMMVEAAGLDETHTWDVASLAVDSVVAGADPRIAPALLSVMFGALRDNAATSLVAMLDSTARRALQGLGMRLIDLPGAKPETYLGSASTLPVYRHLADLHREHAMQFPHIHQQVFHGRGIDGLLPTLSEPCSSTLLTAV
jgi:hypothetical protein